MRITTFMIFNQFANSLGNNLGKLSTVQEQLASGKRVTKPSDDVIALRGAMAYKVSINGIEQFNRNIDEGLSALSFTESSLRSTTNLLNRARELALSESSDTSNGGTREITSFEVQNLFNQLLDTANSKLNNKYLFSGYLMTTPAFSSAGVYQGDSNNMEIHIGNGIKSKVNITGDTAFSDSEKLSTTDLTGQTMSGNLRITSGSGTPFYLESSDVMSSASPEEIRDIINAPMTGTYASTDAIGTGTLTLQAGSDSPVTLIVDSSNNTPELLRDAINGLNMGITAGIFRDASNNQRIFFRPTTPGEAISIDVTSDSDGNKTDSVGLSALLHTDLKSNLTANALGVETFVIDDGTEKRMIFEPASANTTFTIDVDENNNGTWNEAGDIDSTGLSLLYHASSSTTNLNNSVSYFTILNHFANSLRNNDSAGIQASILLLDGALDSVVNNTADVGARLKYMDDQKGRLEGNDISLKTGLATLEDADIASVAMEMTKIQTTLESMRIASVKSLSQSLFDFLN